MTSYTQYVELAVFVRKARSLERHEKSMFFFLFFKAELFCSFYYSYELRQKLKKVANNNNNEQQKSF
jgi:hypothetical protein